MSNPSHKKASSQKHRQESAHTTESICPVCGAQLIQEKCKVVCRSPQCVYRIIYNCAEF